MAITAESLMMLNAAREAAKRVKQADFSNVRRGEFYSSRKFWSRSRAWLMACWHDAKLALRADGKLFLLRYDMAFEVKAKVETLIALFRPHRDSAWWVKPKPALTEANLWEYSATAPETPVCGEAPYPRPAKPVKVGDRVVVVGNPIVGKIMEVGKPDHFEGKVQVRRPNPNGNGTVMTHWVKVEKVKRATEETQGEAEPTPA